MSVTAEVVLLLAGILLGWTYLGYPAAIAVLARLRLRPIRAAPCEPTVALVVVAQDEAAVIEERVRNLLALDYPKEKLTLVIASDGSMDATVSRAIASARGKIEVKAFARRRGKPAVLNEVLPGLREEIVVLADARQRFEPGALRALVAPFADPEVGAVGGELHLDPPRDGPAVGEGFGFYWRYERWIRAAESRVDSTAGVSGAIWALRRELFAPIPEGTILDDVLLPMTIVRRGFRVVFEPGARAWDPRGLSEREELARKVRTIAGTFQLFARERWLLRPGANRLCWQTLSHKAARLLSPALLAVAMLASLALLDRPLGQLAVAGQFGFYAAASIGRARRARSRDTRLFTVPYAFCLLQWTTLRAATAFALGRATVSWKRPANVSEAP